MLIFPNSAETVTAQTEINITPMLRHACNFAKLHYLHNF